MTSMNWFTVPNLVNLWHFRKIPCKFRNMRAQICQYLQRNVFRGGEATVYCSNYYENQSEKLIIFLFITSTNQSTYYYSFTSLSLIKQQKKAKRTVITQNVSEIFNLFDIIKLSDFLYLIMQRERELSWDYLQCYEHFRHILSLHNFLSLLT